MPKRTRSRKGAPGIVDVARRAGVSPATVSRAFNNPQLLRGPTRKRIEVAAQDLGYIRDRVAGAMHNRFSGTIGLIVPTIDNAIFAELIEAFSTHLQEFDRTMLVAAHGYNLAQEVAIIRSLLERRTDGIVLTGLDHDQVALNMLAQRDVPVISIWNYEEEASLPCIGADNFDAGYQITRHVLECGHKDIAFVFPEILLNDRARGRKQGALAAAGEYGCLPDPARLCECSYDLGESKALAQSILKDDPPSAFVCGNDIIAHGIIYGCQAAGLTVPQDVSVAGIGDFRGSAHMEPGLTTVRLPAKQIGTKSAEAIIYMSETGMAPHPRCQQIDINLIQRGSVAFMGNVDKPYDG